MIEFVNSHADLILFAMRVYLIMMFCMYLWAYLSTPWGAPWLPSSFAASRKMLEMANIKPGELVVDLGAGDGRVVVLAAMKYDAQAIGIEIDPIRCLIANLVIILLGLRKKAHVYYGNFFSFDITSANVVVLYLLRSTNQHLKKKLAKELRIGTRIVSNSFAISGWSPSDYDKRRKVLLYKIGKRNKRS
jgi:hypothetical protein